MGSNRLIPIDVRIIAATSRNLQKDVDEGRFRPDLFYRLNVMTLDVPPCASASTTSADRRYPHRQHRPPAGRTPRSLSADAVTCLAGYIRGRAMRGELSNMLERGAAAVRR